MQGEKADDSDEKTGERRRYVLRVFLRLLLVIIGETRCAAASFG